MIELLTIIAVGTISIIGCIAGMINDLKYYDSTYEICYY